jgi:hypothetical protein
MDPTSTPHNEFIKKHVKACEELKDWTRHPVLMGIIVKSQRLTELNDYLYSKGDHDDDDCNEPDCVGCVLVELDPSDDGQWYLTQYILTHCSNPTDADIVRLTRQYMAEKTPEYTPLDIDDDLMAMFY